MRVSVFYRIAAIAALSIFAAFAQDGVPAPAPTPDATAASSTDLPGGLQPDLTDPGVIRAQEDLRRIQLLINEGALPLIRLKKAKDDLQNALDMSMLRKSVFSQDLLPEQADEMVLIAQRIVLRRQRAMIEMQQLVSSGVISRSEAQASGADFDNAQAELHLAETRARLIQEMAERLRIEKGIAALELQAESHPDWAGKVYTRYDGSGVFTRADLQKVSTAFASRFAKELPISADGETALHRSLGFDHRGRVDVAVSPDQPEGVWLMHFLQTNKIPYFAFRMAVRGMATGAHIHIGPGSTRLAMSD